MYNYADAAFIKGIFILSLFVIVVMAVMWVFTPSKTRSYRKTLADLYVSAKIRSLALRDKLDLDKEFEKCKLWEKGNRRQREEYRLDNAVEEELKEEINKKIK